ncbi:methyl-accepting chemotaxis protein [Cellulomonas soli]|uniref:methyl-accepting chemotaxis protein n=1 Tax=Cellulomonas soli TaxID=931535 RepID=UPI003F858857
MRLSRRDDRTAAAAGTTVPTAQNGSVAVPVDTVRRLMNRGDDLGLAVEDLAESCERVNASTVETARSATTASAATAQVEAGSGQVAAAVQQMAAAMREVAQSAATATSVTALAAEATHDVRNSVERLTASTTQIEGVVGIVTGISDRTRMLALNATIEAARAGEAGKGFAVVAEEVKNLAAQSGDATTRIGDQLAELTADSDGVRAAVDRIDEVLGRIEALQQTIAAAVEEQTAAIESITRSATESADAARDLDEAASASTSAAHDAAEAIERAMQWLGRVSTNVREQREEIAALSSGIEVHPLRAALVAHAAWKRRLRDSIDTGRMPQGTTLAAAGRDDACAFGKWLHGTEARALDAARCRTVTALHAEFHRSAARVLTEATAGRAEAARAAMAAGDGYAGAAAALTDALVEWAAVVEGPGSRAA